MAALKQQIN